MRSWYAHVHYSSLGDWSPSLSLHPFTGSSFVITDTRTRLLLLSVTYFKFPLTTLCTLAWTTWNFSSLVTIYQSPHHLPLWMSSEPGRQTLRSPSSLYSWTGFCRVKMTWPNVYWWVSGPILLTIPGPLNSTEVVKKYFGCLCTPGTLVGSGHIEGNYERIICAFKRLNTQKH